jgi:hypothetical protein
LDRRWQTVSKLACLALQRLKAARMQVGLRS